MAYHHTFFREMPDGTEVAVEVEFSFDPGSSGTYWEPPDPIEIEIIKAHTEAEGWAAKWSDAEDEKWTTWLYENFDTGHEDYDE